MIKPIRMHRYLLAIYLLILPVHLFAQDSLLQVLSEELGREKKVLDMQPVPPYYMDYRGNDLTTLTVSSSFGSLTGSDINHARLVAADIRVGGYRFDNTHDLKKGGYDPRSDNPSVTIIPFNNKPLAIRQSLWLLTDEAYRNAVNTLQMIKASLEGTDLKKDTLDFSREKPSVFDDGQGVDLDSELNKPEWEKRIKLYSKVFADDSLICKGEAQATFLFNTKYFVSTEGSRTREHSAFAQVLLMAMIKSREGEMIPLARTFTATLPSRLPPDSVVLAEGRQMLKDLHALRDAKVAEPFSGPALFSPAASGVFFHEIFGHRIEGQRMNNDDDGQTFRDKVNAQVMPKFISVYSDPTATDYNGVELLGHYHYDEQGVAGQRVEVVKDGILRNFLMSRTPLDNFVHSNGHGRAQAGLSPASRQSNLFIESDKLTDMKDLRKKLISECKKQGKKYGYYFKEVFSGYTLTDRNMPNAFKVMPTMVYRIYTDGRPDELVRGVDMIGTPLNMFSEIEATSGPYGVFNGICVAESGAVPVSTIAPAFFVKKVETQKQTGTDTTFPMLKRPGLQ